MPILGLGYPAGQPPVPLDDQGHSRVMNLSPQELVLAGAEHIPFDALEPAMLFALATYEGDLEVATAAIVELGGRAGAGASAMEAVRLLIASSWADRHLKAAALDTAFSVDAAAAAEVAHGLLQRTQDPVLIRSMIHGVTGADHPFNAAEASFVSALRKVAMSSPPSDPFDLETWEQFINVQFEMK